MRLNEKIYLVVIMVMLMSLVCIFPVSAGAFALSKTDSPDPVSPGDKITYTITWQNINTDPDQFYFEANVSDTLDSNTEFISASGIYRTESNKIIWDMPWGILPGESGTLTLVTRVKPGTPEGTVIHNEAMVQGIDEIWMWEAALASSDTTVTSAPPVPEFPTMILPFAGILGLILVIAAQKHHK